MLVCLVWCGCGLFGVMLCLLSVLLLWFVLFVVMCGCVSVCFVAFSFVLIGLCFVVVLVSVLFVGVVVVCLFCLCSCFCY